MLMLRQIVWFLGVVIVLHLSAFTVSAQEDLDKVKREIEELQQKLEQVQSEKQSLSQTVSFLNTKISLAQAEINHTEAEINSLQNQINALEGKIGILNTNLEKISEVLVNRIAESYKNANNTQPVMLLMLSNQFSDLFRTFKISKSQPAA
jgi:peptidoglycan hydrolase CwlO-like protein